MMKRISMLGVVIAFTISMAWPAVVSGSAIEKIEKPPPPPWRGTAVHHWVEAARLFVKTVSDGDVKAAIEKRDKAIILDVRDPDEFMTGHLPGAINVSRGKLEFAIWGAIKDRDAKIFVYCLRGPRAALSTETLNRLGYRNAFLMETHAIDFEKKGFPIVKP